MMEAAWRPVAETGVRPEWMPDWMEPFNPFLPTDGYFILSTLLNEYNLRARGWRAVAGFWRGRIALRDVPLLLYVAGVAWMVIRAALTISGRAEHLLATELPRARGAPLAIVALWIAGWAWQRAADHRARVLAARLAE